MLRNYLMTAWRSLLRNKLFSLINVFGLALSMSVGIIALITLSDALSYDTFHPNRDNIYRILSKITNPQGDNWKLASSPLPLSDELNEQASNNILTTKIYPAIHSVIKDNTREFEFDGVFIEPAFFEIFGYQLTSNPSVLDKPATLLMSEVFAIKFFGDLDPTGRAITIENFGEFEIAGIIKTPPVKSHISYDVFVSMQSLAALEREGKLPPKSENWDSFEQGYTYVRIADKNDLQTVRNALDQVSKNISEKSAMAEQPEQRGKFEFELQPLASISPSPADIFNDIGRGPSRGGLLAEFGIVMIILVAACFNYTNLSIARALTRSKEIGVRKLSGATRLQIITQYVIEALLISMIALAGAMLILTPILQYKPFNDGYEMIPELHVGWLLIGSVVGFTLLAALMAGLLPAWLLSSFKPVRVLRSMATEKMMGRISLRKSLLVFQFSLSLVVLVFLSTFYMQFNFLANADPGFNREGVLLIPGGSNAEVTATSFGNISGVGKAGFTSARFGHGTSINASRENKSKQPVSAEYYACDRSWIDIMGLTTVAGSPDLQHPDGVVLNEKAVVAVGFQNVQDAIGSTIYIRDSLKVTVVGVVKDFYSSGYGNSIRPIIFQGNTSLFKTIAIQADRSDASFIDQLGSAWKKGNPSYPFEYMWLDEEMGRNNDQTATVSLLGFLGFITLTIASLGLLGLVVYTVEVKRKEISVRKIIGASVRQLVTLLSTGFLWLLLIAGCIALPTGYVLSELFLMNFVNHITLSGAQLVICFSILLSIGLITILSQTVTAANEDPARNLRSE